MDDLPTLIHLCRMKHKHGESGFNGCRSHCGLSITSTSSPKGEPIEGEREFCVVCEDLHDDT